ncbi:MAG: DHH family phosphoesterase [Proteobacteria bacterium]|nr:DHH family phosphoesterase [Pseudomonadota bacterium]
MTISASERLRKFYGVFKNDDQVLVAINADPDAIGAALAVKRLLWRRVASVSICSVNTVKRPDNVAMVELLGVNLLKAVDVSKTNYSRFVIVDSQKDHHELFKKYEFDVIIDHHPPGKHKAAFTDIRPEYGATSSMMTEYIKAAKIRPSMKLATALFLGIKTDTNDFQRRAFGEDVKAFQFLFKHINLNLVQKIEYAEINPGFLKYFQIAFNTRVMRRGRVYVHLGHVGTPDVCVLVADFFMKVKGVGWSFVSGIFGKKLVVIFRNDGMRTNAGKVAEKSFGKLGSAGGHKSMARAEVPLCALQGQVDFDHDKKMLRWLIERIEQKKS